MVLDNVRANKGKKAIELLPLAVAQGAQVLPHTGGEDDPPMARKASLQRFMEMRKGRVAMLSLPSLLCRPWHRFAATLRPFTHSRQVSISHMPCR